MSTARILEGDCLDVLATLPERSVQTCITSPPYFGLRDYGTAEWSGGDAACDHKASNYDRGERADRGNVMERTTPFRRACGKCGATRTDSQIGLEETPEQYVANLVAVFREVRRVLRDDGTLWLNLGDSYASQGGPEPAQTKWQIKGASDGQNGGQSRVVPVGVKPKDLLGIPWMVAFALRADGWYLRSDIIWAKPNPMPESVTDRPTKAHEYLFLLSKSRSYFWDADAVREPHGSDWIGRPGVVDLKANGDRNDGGAMPTTGNESGRNKRSVWTVATQPFPGAHFATFPPKLIEPCVLAGSSPQACAECGAPWERVTERATVRAQLAARGEETLNSKRDQAGVANGLSVSHTPGVSVTGTKVETLGWQPTCDHSDGSARCTVLDPFSGAGTTGVVALRHDRDYIGIELNPTYAQMARDRIYDDGPLLNLILGDAA